MSFYNAFKLRRFNQSMNKFEYAKNNSFKTKNFTLKKGKKKRNYFQTDS